MSGLALDPRVPEKAGSEIGRVVVDLRVGQSLQVGDAVTLQVLSKSGRQARLLVCAPRDHGVKKSDD